MSKIEILRQHVMRLYNEHLAASMLPTSIRFLFYELVALTIVAKQASGVLKPGAVGQRRPDQDVIDAITSLRESGDIPWNAIVDETRSINNYTGWSSIADGVSAYLDTLELDPWDGAAALILTESRSLAGVLRALMREYRVMIAPTNGQTNGFLRNDVAPLIGVRTRVLYLGDWDFSGGHIEANTRSVLERAIGRDLVWERLALTEAQVNDRTLNLTVIDKFDRRTRTTHPSVETEALSQQRIVSIVRTRLDMLLPEPLEDVHEREEAERGRLRELLEGAP
jgi:hypothetical protein